MGNIVLRLLQLIAPVFVLGYAFGWLETMQYTTPEVKYDPDTILSLRSAVMLQFASLIGIAASIFAFWEGEEGIVTSVFGFLTFFGIAVFYGFFSTPYILLAIISGFNFPYVFCFITWAGPVAILGLIRAFD